MFFLIHNFSIDSPTLYHVHRDVLRYTNVVLSWCEFERYMIWETDWSPPKLLTYKMK